MWLLYATQFKKKKQVSLDINNFKGRWPFELLTPENNLYFDLDHSYQVWFQYHSWNGRYGLLHLGKFQRF